MALKIFKSYTKSSRGTVLVDRKNLWKGKSLKSLTSGKSSKAGRNNLGRITSRRMGGGIRYARVWVQRSIMWTPFRKMSGK